MISIVPFERTNLAYVHQAADLLHRGFIGVSNAWSVYANALTEVADHTTDEHVTFMALHNHTMLGWIAANPQYDGNAWELHPLVVAPHARHQGIGRRLVTALALELRQRGAQTLFVWCDDESDATSLSRTALYPNPVAHMAQFHTQPPHAGGFYLKLGFVLAGVLPNANGPGKPDILFVLPVADA